MRSESLKARLARRLIAPTVALATIASFGVYEIAKPAVAKAAKREAEKAKKPPKSSTEQDSK